MRRYKTLSFLGCTLLGCVILVACGGADSPAGNPSSGLSGKFGNKEAQPKHLDQGEKALE